MCSTMLLMTICYFVAAFVDVFYHAVVSIATSQHLAVSVDTFYHAMDDTVLPRSWVCGCMI